MIRAILSAICLICWVSAASADKLTDSAMSAAPESLSKNATIMNWDFKVVRKGTNGWTCFPDRKTPGNDPWCVNEPWVNALKALFKKEKPTYTGFGVAYMLQDDTPMSNMDPYETKPTGPEDWVTGLGPHLMLLLPDKEMLKAFPTDHRSGGPWVMWPDTPYAHLMVPLQNRGQ
jgi:hypothetical protein